MYTDAYPFCSSFGPARSARRIGARMLGLLRCATGPALRIPRGPGHAVPMPDARGRQSRRRPRACDPGRGRRRDAVRGGASNEVARHGASDRTAHAGRDRSGRARIGAGFARCAASRRGRRTARVGPDCSFPAHRTHFARGLCRDRRNGQRLRPRLGGANCAPIAAGSSMGLLWVSPISLIAWRRRDRCASPPSPTTAFAC